MLKKPFEHPHAKTFEYRTEIGADGKSILILEVGTDLKGRGWPDTAEGESLKAAIDEYICAPDCRARRIDVISIH